jgi:hypothetical protein
MRLIPIDDALPAPEEHDFVWGSVDWGRRALPDRAKLPSLVKYLRPFGEVITSWTPEEPPKEFSQSRGPKQ